MSETSATHTINNKLTTAGCFVQRVEDSLTPGVPDTFVKVPGGSPVWIEGKFKKKLPVRASTLITLGSPKDARLTFQANWLRRYKDNGGIALWWLRVPNGWYLFDNKFEAIKDGFTRDFLTEKNYYETSAQVVTRIIELARRNGP